MADHPDQPSDGGVAPPPAEPPTGSVGLPGPPSGGHPWPAGPPLQSAPPVAVSRPASSDTSLHPLLPAGRFTHVAHLQPHAASAGPSDGARGAQWFAIAMAVLVVLSLLLALVLAAAA